MTNDTAVLVLAPIGRDAELLLRALSQAGVAATELPDFPAALQAAQSGEGGALLLTAEAVSPAGIRDLRRVLETQPHWSDMPVLVLVPGGRESFDTGKLEASLRSLPNVTLLERPIRPATLASAAQSALKNRRRQYEVKRVIEERDRTAASLIESEKLAAVGRLAASISHEINNPLEAITNLLYLLQQEQGLPATARQYLEAAQSELLRASYITQQSLRFHRQATRPRSITAEELLAPVTAIYLARMKNCGVELRLGRMHPAPVFCFEGEIRQVLSNLAGNAIDAMRSGGRLYVRARAATDWSTARPGIVITIADNGHGMPPEVTQRIFDAFYTTKGIGGTGLGLWISSEIVRKHHGRLRVRSCTAQGRSGTVFRLFLPVQTAEALEAGRN